MRPVGIEIRIFDDLLILSPELDGNHSVYYDPEDVGETCIYVGTYSGSVIDIQKLESPTQKQFKNFYKKLDNTEKL